MHQKLSFLSALLAMSVTGCLSQHCGSLASDSPLMYPKQLLDSSIRAYNFKKIKLGMHRRDVEKLLGGGPGNYRPQRGTVMSTMEGIAPNADIWNDGPNSFEIAFDENDTVTHINKREGFYMSR